MTDYDEYVKKASKALRDHGAPTPEFPDDEFECCAREALKAVGFEDLLLDAELNAEGYKRELADLRAGVEALAARMERVGRCEWTPHVRALLADVATSRPDLDTPGARGNGVAGSGEQPGETFRVEVRGHGYGKTLAMAERVADAVERRGLPAEVLPVPAPVVPDSAGVRERVRDALFRAVYTRMRWVDVGAGTQADIEAQTDAVLAVVGQSVSTEQASEARAEALTAAARWIERIHPAGLTSRAAVAADLDLWAERATRGIGPSGRPYRAVVRSDEKEG